MISKGTMMLFKDLMSVVLYGLFSLLAYNLKINWLSILFAIAAVGMAGFIIWVIVR